MDDLVEDRGDDDNIKEDKIYQSGILHLQPNDIFETSRIISDGLLTPTIEHVDENGKDIKDLIINIDTTQTPNEESTSLER